MDWFADDAGEWADGAGANMIGAAEDRDAGGADCIGDVHCATIVGEHELAIGYELDEFAQGGAAGIVLDLNSAGFEASFDDGNDVCFCRAAEERDSRATGQSYISCSFGESLGIPTLGTAECGTGADANYRLGVTFDTVKADGRVCVIAVNPAGETQEFEVVEPFVADHGHVDRMSEQEAAAVAIEAGTFGDACEESEGGSLEGILQQERFVEASSQGPGQGESG